MQTAMCNSDKGSISLTVIRDKERYKIQLDEADGSPTVKQLAEQIADVTKIPTSSQRLICKGRSLTDFAATLDSYGIKSGSRVMVLMSKSGQSESANIEEDNRVKVMTSVDKVVGEYGSKLDDIRKQFSDIEAGYLAADLQDEAVTRLKRQLAGCIEMLTKQLEQLDGLSLAEAPDELKSRRKATVERIQAILDAADKLMNDVKERSNHATAL